MSKHHNNTGDFDIPDIPLIPPQTQTCRCSRHRHRTQTPTFLEADEEITDTDDDPESALEDEEDTPLPFWHWQRLPFLGLSLPIIGGILLAIVALVVTSLSPHRRQATT